MSFLFERLWKVYTIQCEGASEVWQYCFAHIRSSYTPLFSGITHGLLL